VSAAAALVAVGCTAPLVDREGVRRGEIALADVPADTTTVESAALGRTVAATPDTTAPPATLPAGPIDVAIEWTYVNEGNLPSAGLEGGILGMPFVIDDGTTQRIAFVSGVGPYWLWTSNDGMEWQRTEVRMPSGADRLEVTPSGYWLFDDHRTALWYSPDLESGWEAINLEGLVREAPYGRRFEIRITGAARVGTVTLVLVTYDGAYDWEEMLGLEPGTYANIAADFLENSEGIRVVDVFAAADSGAMIAHLRPIDTDEGASWIDSDTGEEALFLSNEGRHALFEATPDGLKEIDVASGMGYRVGLLELSDSVRVEMGLLHGEESLQTQDGRAFAPIPPPPEHAGPILYDPNSGFLYSWLVEQQFGGSVTEHWISSDGVNWAALDTPVELENPFVTGEMSVLHRLTSGWLIMKVLKGNVIESYFSPDGQKWRAVDQPPMVDADSFLADPFGVWGDRVMRFHSGSNWVGRLEVGD
jgi:hypothetical protein